MRLKQKVDLMLKINEILNYNMLQIEKYQRNTPYKVINIALENMLHDLINMEE